MNLKNKRGALITYGFLGITGVVGVAASTTLELPEPSAVVAPDTRTLHEDCVEPLGVQMMVSMYNDRMVVPIVSCRTETGVKVYGDATVSRQNIDLEYVLPQR